MWKCLKKYIFLPLIIFVALQFVMAGLITTQSEELRQGFGALALAAGVFYAIGYLIFISVNIIIFAWKKAVRRNSQS